MYINVKAETYKINDPSKILTPALIYYEDIIRENTKKVIEMAGGPRRLWPHVKSHKMTEMVKMQLHMGITRFKCATLAEAEMAAAAGAGHVLLAYPLVGPNMNEYLNLTKKYPAAKFYALGDDLNCLAELDAKAAELGVNTGFFIDVNMGMNRTGVETGSLYEFVKAALKLASIRFCGLHCYDGQVHTADITERGKEVEAMTADIQKVIRMLKSDGVEIPAVIAGGSPTFPCHIPQQDVFLSPGTVFLWDSGYLSSYPDLGLTPGAAVMTRVISHPAQGLFTLDLGCKAIACDPQGSRGVVTGLEHASALFQSEEHWVYKMDPGFENHRPRIGEVFYVIPTHICPTTALYSRAITVKNGEVTGSWHVDARR